MSILQSNGCLVQVADLPEGSDPDSYIREKGAAAFTEIIQNAKPLMEYRLLQLKKRFDLVSDRGRINYIEELMPFLTDAVNQVEQDYYLKRAAEELGVDEDALRSEMKKRKRSSRPYRLRENNKEPDKQQKPNIRPEEKIIISLMLQSKEIAEKGRNLIQLEYFQDQQLRKVIESIWDIIDEKQVLSAERLINKFTNQEVAGFITEAVTDPALQDLPAPTAKRMFDDCLNKIYETWAKKQQLELQKRIKELESRGCEQEIEELLRKHHELLMKKDGDHYRL